MLDPERNSFVEGNIEDSRENKTGFMRDLTLSVLLYF